MADPDELEELTFDADIKDVVVAALYSPFVVCMAAGTLPLEDFHVFIKQDEYILKAFLCACMVVESWVVFEEDKAALRDMRVDLMLSLNSLDSIFQRCGVDRGKKYNSTPATTKYTDFITSTASGNVVGERGPLNFETPDDKSKVSAYSVDTMVPCLNLNAYLATEIKKILDAHSHHRYRTWVDNYSSDTFKESVTKFERLLTQLMASFTDYESDVVKKVYLEALKLRVDFFPSLTIGEQSVVPFCKMRDPAKDRLEIFSDFDVTCSLNDSGSFVEQMSLDSAPQVLGADRKSQEEMNIMWQSLSNYVNENIVDEFRLCMDSILSSHKAQNFNHQGLREAVQQFSRFQKKMNSHMTEMMVLKGINMEHLKREAGKIQLQRGCMNFFQQVAARKVELNADIHIISYCLCGDIIRSVFSSGGLESINVHSNELAYENSLTTGEIMSKIESPDEKLQVFEDTLLRSGGSGKAISVYIGRHMGDLLCLLEADIGIIVGNNLNLRRLCDHFGVSRVSLFSGAVRKQKELVARTFSWKEHFGVLYEVSTWSEIQAFLLGSN